MEPMKADGLLAEYTDKKSPAGAGRGNRKLSDNRVTDGTGQVLRRSIF